MLQRTFLPVDKLGITPLQYTALIKVLGLLERGEIDERHFDMCEWWGRGRDHLGRYCGTVGCIGGWADHCIGEPAFADIEYGVGHCTIALLELFHPVCDGAWRATPQQAAQAVSNFLTTGWARWGEVLGEWAYDEAKGF